ncbi:hypothetical protein F4560_000917 [Saccharothrix ecbatanensis]|uniref:Uncharacterized protein n=1 Tax=Saccharothrix ecbatanensis TaxID=1105145 RepID=A0A7W9LYS3_9PSEU|nr:hypothetical protein [Saccharothrix ecbatanensis]MBB5801149.1 hypothetical protein [Saccharothrix ecbatanensis]
MTARNPAVPDPGPALRLLFLAAGVKRTTVLLLACEGEIPRFDLVLCSAGLAGPPGCGGRLGRVGDGDAVKLTGLPRTVTTPPCASCIGPSSRCAAVSQTRVGCRGNSIMR